MTFEEIKKIVIVGAGTMGSGIAQMSALAGYETVLFDIQASAIKKAEESIEKNLDGGIKRNKLSEEDKIACLSRISFTDSFEDLKGDVIIEAIVEKLTVKKDLFQRLELLNDPKTIFATNTSSIPVTRIAAELNNPERMVGMHFFNPAHIMKLVEVISGVATSPAIAEATKALAEKMGKKAVMAKDSPGFIVNRVARHFYVESLKVLEENVSDTEGIDQLLKATGFRMGPFELLDLIGVDVNYSVTCSMFESFHQEARFRPNRIQQQLVDAGHFGRKSGKGFYDYTS